MALDFPTSPTNGQKYPASPIAGIPTYTWDGEKWTTGTATVASVYVAKAGDTMSGLLTLSADPSTALQAAPKQYVDARPSAITADTMPPLSSPTNSLWWESDTGVLHILYDDTTSKQWVGVSGPPGPQGPSLDPTSNPTVASVWILSPTASNLFLSKGAGNSNSIQGAVGVLLDASDYKARWDILVGNGAAETGSNAGTDFVIQGYADNGTTILGPSLTINRASGLATVKADPTAALGVATKQYVDLRAPLASPVFTGDPQAPTPATADNDTSIATTAWVKSQYLQNSVVFDPPSLATGVVGAIQTLTVTGAAVGDFCLASFSVDLTGMTLLAWVSATNTTKFQFQNKTAGTLDLASGTVRVRVWKQ